MRTFTTIRRTQHLLVAATVATLPTAASADPWSQLYLTPRSPAEVSGLRALGYDLKAVTSGDEPAGTASLVVPAAALPAIAGLGVPYRVVHPDLAAFYRTRLSGAVAPFAADPRIERLGVGSMGGYFTLTEVIAEMDALAAAFPAVMAAKTSIGTSVEGREIWAWKLSRDPALDEDEPEVVIVALMHAREPAGMMSVVYLAETLTGGYGNDPEVTYLLDHREVWLVPVLNPDGYTHNEATEPSGGGLWRKNRVDNGDGSRGVDLNRNFAYEWGHDDVGSSPTPSANTYRGPTPFSEPETQALRDFVIARRPNVTVNTHTFGDYLIRSWAYDNLFTTEDAEYEDMSRLLTRGNAYRVGNFWTTLGYLGNGDHDAWMHGETAAKPRAFSFTPELGNSTDGFWPATARILPLAEEALPMHLGFVWMAGPAPRIEAVTVDDSAGGDGDGIAELGEIVAVTVALRNHGSQPTWGALTAELVSPVCALRVTADSSDYGVIDWQQTADNGLTPFVLQVDGGLSGEVVTLNVRARDDRGTYPEMSFDLLIGEPQVLFADDLESGIGNWSLNGWDTGPAGASATGTALTDSPGASYPNDDDATAAIDRVFDLSGFDRAYLEFGQRFWIDNDFDAGRVEVSTDGGASWEAVRGADADDPSGVGRQDDGAPVYDGHIFDWTAERIALNGFTGFTDVRLRFRLLTDGSHRKDGWLVDDVRVVAFLTPPGQAPNDPAPLYAVAATDDVALSWPEATADPGHDPALDYVVHRAPTVRADGGFAPLLTVTAPAATDPGARRDATSYAYQVVAENCAGASSIPP